MNTQEIKNRIKKCEDELAELRNELELKVGWEDVFKGNLFFFEPGWAISGRGSSHGRLPNLPTEASIKKMLTYGKLLALQHYLGAGGVSISYCNGVFSTIKFTCWYGVVGFKNEETAMQAIDIFKANGDEQELIDFLK